MNKKTINYLAAAMLCCSSMFTLSSCQGLMDAIVGTEDKPVTTPTTPTNDAAQLKQGIWTEYDTALLTSGKYTEDELAQMPTVAMWIQGDKASFFTYTAETVSETVEGQISYNKSANTGTITFPNIAGNPLSIQTVNFSMTSDETMQFEFTYGGQTTTGTCAWLCENLDNWSSDITDADWLELMAYYESISAEGPDASIDWSGSATVTVEDVDDEGKTVKKEVTVTDLDKPLEWNEDGASSRAGTRIAIATAITTGLKVFGALFEEDPAEEINAKLDAVLGKLDNVLRNQQVMNAKLDEINERLVALAQKLNQQETVNIFNNRTQTYYNPLKVRNTAYFNDAFKLYNDNKSDLSKVKSELGEYGKLWVGNDEKYMSLTWNYIEYLKTVQHSSYGTGMASIYDGVTFDKYPWEHMGIGDRKNYRANDMIMIAKCLFMINLYAAYGGGSDKEKKGIYNNYNDQKPKLKEFCEFKISDPDKFRVCQIPGAHFIMHKEIQKYNYYGKDGAAPNPTPHPNRDAVFRPEWHEAGSIKIENPKELKEKLIREDEAEAFHKYYRAAVFSNQDYIWWTKMLVGADDNKLAAGAVLAKQMASPNNEPYLLLSMSEQSETGMSWNGLEDHGTIRLSVKGKSTCGQSRDIGRISKHANGNKIKWTWDYYDARNEFYIAIVEKRY